MRSDLAARQQPGRRRPSGPRRANISARLGLGSASSCVPRGRDHRLGAARACARRPAGRRGPRAPCARRCRARRRRRRLGQPVDGAEAVEQRAGHEVAGPAGGERPEHVDPVDRRGDAARPGGSPGLPRCSMRHSLGAAPTPPLGSPTRARCTRPERPTADPRGTVPDRARSAVWRPGLVVRDPARRRPRLRGRRPRSSGSDPGSGAVGVRVGRRRRGARLRRRARARGRSRRRRPSPRPPGRVDHPERSSAAAPSSRASPPRRARSSSPPSSARSPRSRSAPRPSRVRLPLDDGLVALALEVLVLANLVLGLLDLVPGAAARRRPTGARRSRGGSPAPAPRRRRRGQVGRVVAVLLAVGPWSSSSLGVRWPPAT